MHVRRGTTSVSMCGKHLQTDGGVKTDASDAARDEGLCGNCRRSLRSLMGMPKTAPTSERKSP